jgi:DNA polymerase-3 subunit beta
MKFSVDRSEFSTALANAARAVASSSSHPILNNVLIEAKGDSLSITGFNLSIGIRCTCPATVEANGAVAVPCSLLNDIVSRLTSETIVLTLEENQLGIVAGTGRFKLNCMDPEEYPALYPPGSDRFSISGESLLGGLAVLYAASTDETKQVLNGCNIQSSEDTIYFAATDGHRLAMIQVDSEGALPSVNLPTHAGKALGRMVKPSDAVTIAYSTGECSFEFGDCYVCCRLLDGAYPSYPRLIPTVFEHEVTVDRKLFLSALGRVAVLIEEKKKLVQITFTQDSLILEVETQDVGFGKESISMERVKGEDTTIAFNNKYLREAIESVRSDNVSILCNSPTNPVLINAIGGGQTNLLMPVQIRE